MELTKTPTVTLVFHVIVGTIAMLSGAGALIFAKGSRPHRMSGKIFVASMMLMTTTGLYLSIMKPATISIVASILTFYLVLTSWMTIRRKEGKTGRFEIVASIVILIAGTASILLGLDALKNPVVIDGFTIPALTYFIFGSVAIFAGSGDIIMVMQQGIRGARRIARHLWRMCFALYIAAGSIFQGNPQVFPENLRGSLILLVPTLAIPALMIFWLIRVRFTKSYSDD